LTFCSNIQIARPTGKKVRLTHIYQQGIWSFLTVKFENWDFEGKGEGIDATSEKYFDTVNSKDRILEVMFWYIFVGRTAHLPEIPSEVFC